MDFLNGFESFLNGIMGQNRQPYSKGMDEYRNWLNQAQGVQQPYYEAGQRGLGNYENWLNTQKDPSKFINDQMQNYQQSPYNTYLQQQSQNAGQNAASASGLLGSTPFLQQQQQNAANISQQGMNDWLQNVLGINTQYGQGQQNLMGVGQNAANSLSNIYGQAGKDLGQATFGRERAGQQDLWNIINGGLGMFGL